MIELLFTVCLFANEDICEERKLTFVENMSPMACMMGAQPELAKWSESHPKWRIGKWKCKMVDTQVVDI